MKRPRAFDPEGFTLIELLIVALIMGIAAMISGPQLYAIVVERKLNGATEEMVAALNYAAVLAVTYQKPFGVAVDAGANRFSVFDKQHRTDPSAHPALDPPVGANGVVFNPLDKNRYEKNFALDRIYEGVRITTAPAGGEIIYYPDGRCAVFNQTIVLGLNDRQRTITVDAITGRTMIQ